MAAYPVPKHRAVFEVPDYAPPRTDSQGEKVRKSLQFFELKPWMIRILLPKTQGIQGFPLHVKRKGSKQLAETLGRNAFQSGSSSVES